MEQENQAVTAPVDTQTAQPIDTIEVETNIEAPEQGTQKETSKTEPTEAPQKPVNPRTQARKAEKERLITELATERERNRQLEEKYKGVPKEEPKQKDFSKEPNIQDYTDVLEYTRDLARYEATNLLSERDKKSAEADRQRRIESFQEQINEVKAEMPDLDSRLDALYNAGLIPQSIEDAVLSSNISGKLAAHLAKFPGDLKQLNSYRPELLPQAIKQLEAFIQNPPKAEEPRVTRAQAPITPPGNSAKTNRSINSYTQEEIENMPLSEYKLISRH